MRPSKFVLVIAAIASFAPAEHAEQAPPPANWAATSECWKPVKGKSADIKIKIGLMTFDLDRASCETIGKSKAVGMAAGGWFCFGSDSRPREITHLCQQTTKAEEDLGLKDVRRRLPVWNTYLVFTDLTGHLTQISFWEIPKPLDSQLCEAFRQDVAKSGVKDAVCIPGKG